jgi:hypothetical protein
MSCPFCSNYLKGPPTTTTTTTGDGGGRNEESSFRPLLGLFCLILFLFLLPFWTNHEHISSNNLIACSFSLQASAPRPSSSNILYSSSWDGKILHSVDSSKVDLDEDSSSSSLLEGDGDDDKPIFFIYPHPPPTTDRLYGTQLQLAQSDNFSPGFVGFSQQSPSWPGNKCEIEDWWWCM